VVAHGGHRDAGTPVVFAEFMDGADVRVIQRRRGAHHAHQMLDRRPVGIGAVWQGSECNAVQEFRILGAMDDAHPKGAQRFQNPVVSNARGCEHVLCFESPTDACPQRGPRRIGVIRAAR